MSAYTNELANILASCIFSGHPMFTFITPFIVLLEHKPELLKCIKALLTKEYREKQQSQSATWLNEVDRGSLWHVQEGTTLCYLQPWKRRLGSI